MVGFAFVGVAFWAWMASVVIAEEMGKTKRRRADLDLIRFAIEKGQPLTPEVVEQILARSTTGLFTGGVVTIAAGIGLMVFAIFLSRISANGGWAVSGAGGIAICVGIGLVISYKLTQRSEPKPDPRT
jgi:hypothetical protein